jgi:hypothetical protein
MAELTLEDKQALVEARFAEIKVALQLNPAQEKNWPAVETALRNVASARAARREEITQLFARAAEAGRTADVSARLSSYAKGLRSRADQVDQLASAAKPLLASLNESQDRRFGLLLARNRRRSTGAKQFASLTRYINRQISQASSKS